MAKFYSDNQQFPAEFPSKVIIALRDEERKIAFRRLLATLLCRAGIAIFFLIVSVLWGGEAFARSDFLLVASAAISDVQASAAYPMEVSFALLETFPTASLLVLCFSLFTVLLFVQGIATFSAFHYSLTRKKNL